MGIFTHESSEIFLYHIRISRPIPDEELIFTLDDTIMWIGDTFPVHEIRETSFSIREIHLAIVIDEISTSEVPCEIREKMSPCRGCHMNMDRISVILMEMDTILWFDSLSDIASSDLFHVDIAREIPFFSIDIDRKIRMPVYLIGPRDDDIGDSHQDHYEDNERNDFYKIFHRSDLRGEYQKDTFDKTIYDL